METRYENNNGTTENVIRFNFLFFFLIISIIYDYYYYFKCHHLSSEELAVRKLEYLDISTERIPDYKYKESEDPCKFKSTKTGRGPLTSNWKVCIHIKLYSINSLLFVLFQRTI